METSIYHTLGLTKIQRTRIFPGRGDVLVRVGQKVEASDAIAQYFPEEKFTIINVVKEMNFNNPEDALQTITVKVGDIVKKGDVVAQGPGALAKSIKSQIEGEVVNILGSQVILRHLQTPRPIYAGFESIVTEILPFRGVVIESNGALIQGVWGNQKIASAILATNMKEMYEELTVDRLDVTLRGSIFLGGYVTNSEVFKAAEELNFRGLILASISASIVQEAINCSIPILLLEGFGRLPINERAFELITTSLRKNASLNTIYDVKKSEKPELVIPLPVEASLPSDGFDLKPGTVVRINSGVEQGNAAILKKVNLTKTKLPNGIRTNFAVVELNNADQISIPLANLDIIE